MDLGLMLDKLYFATGLTSLKCWTQSMLIYISCTKQRRTEYTALLL